ncbi:S41 family peptidase [Sediminibacter sp. Hel_I_10]|uniref:S41 family peptidase n=1 Tax=Sediminibacter sp. Hel_I_10 TaxID=1392490 RepID=UPI00047DF2EA|nr:S41 family peptidase [Sediminibacter sp. Hel_I_10]
MKLLKITLLCLVAITFTGCFEDNDDHLISASEINDFVWKGMNAVYLYKDEIPNLANDRFSSNEAYANYLSSYNAPEVLFESLIYERETIDRFSVIVDDYIALEQQFSGVSISNGMEYGVFRLTEESTEVYGYVRYVLPNTSAEAQNVQRGDVFYGVNGVQLTTQNYRNLLFTTETYNINLATYNDNNTPESSDDSISNTNEVISLTGAEYTENPIFINSVLNVGSETIGYLMYNGFTGTNQFDSQLNSVFGEFQSAGITDLVLDLRYNGGGSVNTAIWLASMITGQHTGELFTREEWNSEIQAQILADNPELLENPFVDEMLKFNNNGEITFQESINSLNLNRVYVLTTRSTASASELVISGLTPYIEVIKIGSDTRGKYQASRTIYDSPNFSRQDANPRHTYALQPLIFKTINSAGFTDFDSGLNPNISISENFGNLGTLGDIDEPFLAEAINAIEGTGRFSGFDDYHVEEFSSSKDDRPFSYEMYVEGKNTSSTNFINR